MSRDGYRLKESARAQRTVVDLTPMMHAAGFASERDFVKAININTSKLWFLRKGLIAPNDPEIAVIEKALKVPADSIAAKMIREPLSEQRVQWMRETRAQRLKRGPTFLARQAKASENGNKRSNRRRRDDDDVGEVLGSIEVPSRALVPVGTGNGNGNGNGTRHAVEPHDPRPLRARRTERQHQHLPTKADGRRGAYNKLRRTDHTLRQATRSLLTTLNVAAMQGETEIANIPTAVLSVVMHDYLQRLGITATMLIDPEFASHFDHT